MAFESAKSTETPAWWKIFAGFRVALDIKKLFLAGAGIFFTALGWWVISATFYSMRSQPRYEDFKADGVEAAESFKRYKRSLAQWNLLHALASPTPTDLASAVRVGPGDVAETPEQYSVLQKLVDWQKDYGKPIVISKERPKELKIDDHTYAVNTDLSALVGKGYMAQDFEFVGDTILLGKEKIDAEPTVLERLRSFKDAC